KNEPFDKIHHRNMCFIIQKAEQFNIDLHVNNYLVLIDSDMSDQELTIFNKFIDNDDIKTILFQEACKRHCNKLVNLFKNSVKCDLTKCLEYVCCSEFIEENAVSDCGPARSKNIEELINMKIVITHNVIKSIGLQEILDHLLS